MALETVTKAKELIKETFETTYQNLFINTDTGFSLLTDPSEREKHRNILSTELDRVLNNPEENDEGKLREVVNNIRLLESLSKEDDPKVIEDLLKMATTLPRNLDEEHLERLGLAVKNYSVEFILSNIVEIGIIDAGAAAAITLMDLPQSVKNFLIGVLAYSAAPLPLPSFAGVTRAIVHTAYSRPAIRTFNQEKNTSQNRHIPIKNGTIRAIDLITTIEYTGTTIGPILNILDAYGLDISPRTFFFILKVGRLLKYEKNLWKKDTFHPPFTSYPHF